MTDEEIKAIEKKKRHLKRYKKNKALVERLEEKLDTLNRRMQSARSPRFTDEPRGGAPVTLDDLLCEKEELETRIECMRAKGRKMRMEILDEIDTLEEVRHAEVLEAFFIDGMTIEEIADTIPCNVRTVYRLYSEGVKILTFNSHKDDIIK